MRLEFVEFYKTTVLSITIINYDDVMDFFASVISKHKQQQTKANNKRSTSKSRQMS